jgi:hypothetical protein
MAFHIRDEAPIRRFVAWHASRAIRSPKPSGRRSGTSTRKKSRVPLIVRLQPVHERFMALRKPGGLPADKVFFDEVTGNT